MMPDDRDIPTDDGFLEEFPYVDDPEFAASIDYPDSVLDLIADYYEEKAKSSLSEEDRQRIESLAAMVRQKIAAESEQPPVAGEEGKREPTQPEERRQPDRRVIPIRMRIALAAAASILVVLAVWQVASNLKPRWTDEGGEAWFASQEAVLFETAKGKEQQIKLPDVRELESRLPGIPLGTATGQATLISPAVNELVLSRQPTFLWVTKEDISSYEVQVKKGRSPFEKGDKPYKTKSFRLSDSADFPKVGCCSIELDQDYDFYYWRVVYEGTEVDPGGTMFRLVNEDELENFKGAVESSLEMASREDAPPGLSEILQVEIGSASKHFLFALQKAEAFTLEHDSNMGQEILELMRKRLNFPEGETFVSVRERYGLGEDTLLSVPDGLPHH